MIGPREVMGLGLAIEGIGRELVLLSLTEEDIGMGFPVWIAVVGRRDGDPVVRYVMMDGEWLFEEELEKGRP